MLKLSGLFNKFNDILARQLDSSLQFSTSFALIGLIGYPLGFILYFQTEVGWIDILGMILSILVLLGKHTRLLRSQHVPFYWSLFLLFTFPFNFSYNLLLNADRVSYALGEMIMFLVLTIVVSDLIVLFTMLILGILLAIVAYYAATVNPTIPNNLANTIPVYVLGVVFGIALSKRKDSTNKNKLEGMFTLAHRMSHELNTPLAIVKLGCANLKKYMPSLKKACQFARKNGLNDERVSDENLQFLNKTIDDISDECSASSRIMEIFLMNAQANQRETESYEQVSIYACVENALNRYPYPHNFTRDRIHWQKSEDFKFKGIELLMIHVFLNLLKNAIRAIIQTGKGEIKIYDKRDKKYYYLYFKDSGMGIKKNDLSNLFQTFFTTHEAGTGLGLHFCKTTLEKFGGNIICESIYQQHTTFILRFPL